jgi:hypothetical protein
MNEPNGDSEEAHGAETTSSNPRVAPIDDSEWQNKEEAESRQAYAYEGEDEIENTLRVFWDFVKRTFREAGPGERLTAWLTMFLILCSLIVAIVYWLQLEQMRKATKASTVAANAATSAAETAKQSMEASNRPWLGAKWAITHDLVSRDGEVWFEIVLMVFNSGHSPALEVSPEVEISPEPIAPFQLRQTCSDADYGVQATERAAKNFGLGAFATPAIFPDPSAPYQEGFMLQMSKDVLARRSYASALPGKLLSPHIGICIAYKSSLPNSPIYHTGYELFLRKKGDAFIPIDRTTPADQLTLTMELGYPYAN